MPHHHRNSYNLDSFLYPKIMIITETVIAATSLGRVLLKLPPISIIMSVIELKPP
jgi:hypothetical protein